MGVTVPGGVQLALENDDILAVHTPDAFHVVLIEVLAHIQYAVVFPVEVDDGKLRKRRGHGGGIGSGKVIGKPVPEEGRRLRVSRRVQERVVAAVAQDEAVVPIQHVARVLPGKHSAPGEQGVGKGAFS